MTETALDYNGTMLFCTSCDRCPNSARCCAPTMELAEVALAEHVAHSHNPDLAMWWDVAPLRGRKSHKEYKKGNRGRPKGSKNK